MLHIPSARPFIARISLVAWALHFTSAAASDPAGATLFLGADGAPRIAYEFPEGRRLHFANTEERVHKQIRSAFWKVEDACFALDVRGLTLAAEDGCRGREIALGWDERARDRMYPGVVRLRNGGVLVFAGYLQTVTPDGRGISDIRLRAPRDGVAAFRHSKSSDELVVGGRNFQNDGRGWFYLGPDRFVEEDVARILVDDGVPASLRAVIVESAPKIARIYAERLGGPESRKPAVYLTWGDRDRPGRSVQADVVPGEIRFTVGGQAWRDADARAINSFRETVAHELAHLWVGEIAQPVPWAAPWLSEGNAELLGIAALLASNAIDARQAADRVQLATAECNLIAGLRPWSAIRERDMGRAPYACGLAIQFAIVAAARRGDATLDAFSLWRAVWRQHPKYYEAVFAQFAERAGDPALAAILQETFTSADVPLVTALERLYALADLRTSRQEGLPAGLAPIAGGQVLAALMAADCKGSYGFDRQIDHYFVDKIACGAFKSDMKIGFIAEHDLFTAPLEAAKAVRSACIAQRSVTVKTRDGDAFGVPCAADTPAALPNGMPTVVFDPSEVARALGRP